MKIYSLFLLVAMLALSTAAEAGSVQLKWDASPTPGVVSYRLYASPFPSVTAAPFSAAVAAVPVPYFMVSDRPAVFTNGYVYRLKETQTYRFRVTAVNAEGVESVPSNEVEFTVPIARPVLNVVGIGTGFVRLGFRDIYDAETGWEIEKSTDGINFQLFATVPAGQQHRTDLGTQPGRVYYYRITAIFGAQRSAVSRVVQAYTEK